MAIFRFSEMFGQLKGDMGRAVKAKADDAKVSAWVGRLTAAKADRARFDTFLAEMQDDSTLSSADLIAVAHTYNKGGKKPTSRSAAIAMIKKRFVEIARFHAKNKVAEKVRPW